jgi:uncharacterized membrane protein YkgB
MAGSYLLEEEIFVEGTDRLLKYSLSNNLNEIINNIYENSGNLLNTNNLDWKLNSSLSISVKNLMNKHSVDYSMTTYHENGHKNVIINRRVGEQWFFTGFSIQDTQLQNNTQYAHENLSESSMAKVGCFLGIINIVNVILVLANYESIIDSLSGDPALAVFAWLIITIVLAITGFFVSKSGHSKGEEGAGIAGMALNGLIILPAIILFIGVILDSSKNRKR